MMTVQVESMTRYSASRGILYSAPPGAAGERTDAAVDAAAEDGETTDRDEDADGAAVEAEGTTADD